MLTKVDNKGTTSYTYDKLNRLSTVTEPSGNVTTYTYDGAGNRASATTVKGGSATIVTYSYNDQNRLMNTVTTVNAATTEKVT